MLTKHGYRKHKLYSVWRNMKTRCYNPNTHNYSNYGGKGIILCNEWVNNAASFIEWSLSNGYQDGLTLDRIDSDGNYEPSNCRWTNLEIQQRNKGKYKNATSEYIGVHSEIWNKKLKWISNVRVNKKLIYLGGYDTPKQAAIVRDSYIVSNNLKGYKLNF